MATSQPAQEYQRRPSEMPGADAQRGRSIHVPSASRDQQELAEARSAALTTQLGSKRFLGAVMFRINLRPLEVEPAR